MHSPLAVIALSTASVLISGCSSESPDGEGAVLFSQPHADGNSFACESCHALEEPATDGWIRPGHPIGDAAARPSFKNGAIQSLLSAVNTCRTEWMIAPAWSEGDPAWNQLREFLVQRAPDTAPALTTELGVPLSGQMLEGGDPVRGRDLFNRTCIVCHGEDGGGTTRAPRITGLELEPRYVTERVRLSGPSESAAYVGLGGGRMPFWTPDRLSDTDLGDVARYVSESDGGGGDRPMDMTDAGPEQSCGVTHPRVGQVAILEEEFHDVAGTATIVDDCTIRVDMFDYDGTGIDVRFYGGIDFNFSDGFAIGGDLRRDGGYHDETLTIQLPPGKTLDDLDSISVWCVDVAVSFGHGGFVDA